MIEIAEQVYGLPAPVAWVIALFPIVGALVLGLLVAFPATHRLGAALLAENRLVENLTVAGYLVASMIGAAFAARLRRSGSSAASLLVVAGLALFAFVGAGEEISWGQQILHFHTPSAIANVNVQHETTVHNIGWIHDLNDWMPLGAGVAMLAGIFAVTRRHRERRGIPSLLAPYAGVIVLLGAYDLFTDWNPIDLAFDTLIAMLGEYAEMLVAFALAIGLWLAWRRFGRAAAAVVQSRPSTGPRFGEFT